MTREQAYIEQMTKLGFYDPIFDPEIRTLCQLERELTRAQKAWSNTAPPGGKPSFLDDHYPVIEGLRKEILQHREALGLTPKAMRRIVGVAGSDAPVQQDLITEKLDRIAESVSAADQNVDWRTVLDALQAGDPYAGIPGAAEAAKISQQMDEDLQAAIAEDMG